MTSMIQWRHWWCEADYDASASSIYLFNLLSMLDPLVLKVTKELPAYESTIDLRDVRRWFRKNGWAETTVKSSSDSSSLLATGCIHTSLCTSTSTLPTGPPVMILNNDNDIVIVTMPVSVVHCIVSISISIRS